MTTKEIQNLAQLARANDSQVRASETHAHAFNTLRQMARLRAEWKHVARFTYANAQAIASARSASESRKVATHAIESGYLAQILRHGSDGKTRDVGNVANIQTVWKTGDVSRAVNPLFDAAQRTFEKREQVDTRTLRETVRSYVKSKTGAVFLVSKTRATTNDEARTLATYRNFTHVLACRIADKYVRRAKVSCAHLRSEFVYEIESAIGLAIANRLARFPRLTSDLLARFACEAIPNTTRRALHFAALKACDRILRHMAKNETHETSYFDAFDASEETTTTDASKLARIEQRCAELLDTLAQREARATGNRERGHVRAARKLVERAREWAQASVASERFAFRTALSFHAEIETVTHVTRDAGKFAGKVTHKRETGKTVSRSALWKRARTLERTLGIALF